MRGLNQAYKWSRICSERYKVYTEWFNRTGDDSPPKSELEVLDKNASRTFETYLLLNSYLYFRETRVRR